MIKGEIGNKIRIMASKVLVTAMLVTCLPTQVYGVEPLDDELLVEEPAVIVADTLYEEADESISQEKAQEELLVTDTLVVDKEENDGAETYISDQNDTFSEDEYIDADFLDSNGRETHYRVKILNGSETSLDGGLYIAQGSINFTHGINISGSVFIILADGCELNFGTEDHPLSCNAISGETLHLYGQRAETGRMNVNVCCVDTDCDAIAVRNYYQWSGHVSVSCKSADGSHHGNAIHAAGADGSGFFQIKGRSLDAVCDGNDTAAINTGGTVVISGGIITASNPDYHGIVSDRSPITISFGGAEGDHITASSYYAQSSSSYPNVYLSNPLVEYDDGIISNIIKPGSYYAEQADVFAGKTLYPLFPIQTDNQYITISGDAIDIDGNKFAPSGSTICLGYKGEMPEGYEVSEFIIGDPYNTSSIYEKVASNGLFSMPHSGVWISDITYATTDVEYVDETGVVRNVSDDPNIGKAIVLTGREQSLDEGWYVAFGNIGCAPIGLSGKVSIIIADDGSINFGSSSSRSYSCAFCSVNSINDGEYKAASLSVYGQENKNGALNLYCRDVPVIDVDGAIRINGVNVYCDSIDTDYLYTVHNAMGMRSGSDIDISNAIVSVNATRTCMEAGGDIKLNNSEVALTTLGDNKHSEYKTIYGEKSIYVKNSKLNQINKETRNTLAKTAYVKGCGEIINSELVGDNIIIDSDISIKNSRIDCEINGKCEYPYVDPVYGYSYTYYNYPETVTSMVEVDDCSGQGNICGIEVSANNCTGAMRFEACNKVFIENCNLSYQEEGKYHEISGECVNICDSEISGHYKLCAGNLSLSRNKIQLTLADTDVDKIQSNMTTLLSVAGTLIVSDSEFSSEGAVKGDLIYKTYNGNLSINNSKFAIVSYRSIWDSNQQYFIDYFGKVYIDNGSEVTVFRSGRGSEGCIRAPELYVQNSKLQVDGGGGQGTLLVSDNEVKGCLHIDEGSDVSLSGYVGVIGDIIINGGKVIGNNPYGYIEVSDGVELKGQKIILGWSNKDDLIKADSFEDYLACYGSYNATHNYDNVVHIMQGKRFIVNSVSINQNYVYDPNFDDEYNYNKTVSLVPEGIIGSLTEETVLNEEQNKALWGKILRPFGYIVTAPAGVSHGVEPTVINGKEYYLYFDDEACVLTTSVPLTGMKKITTTSGTVKQTGTPGEFMLSGLDDDATVSADTVTLTVDDIADQSYAGAPVEPALTVRDGEKVLTEGVDYTVSYTDNVLPGIATATVAGKGAYFGSFTKSFNIVNKTVTVTAKDQRVAVGTGIGSGADMVTAAGLAEGHYIAAAAVTSSQGTSALGDYDGDLVPSSVTIKDADGADVTQYYNITYAAGTLSVTKAQARISTQPYAKTGLKYTGTALELVSKGTSSEGTVQYSTDYDPDDESGTWSADIPVKTGAGSYEVYYKVAGNAEHEDSNVAGPISVSINKTPLIVTAKSKTITYGDTPDNDGVEYSGFVNGETETVLGGSLTYEYGYSQYGDVGRYTITPGGYTSGNYDISYSNGTLTVSAKETGLNWSDAALTYNGLAQVPTASATGLVNGDEVTVTVTGAQTNAGRNYTATATELQGTKAGNYKLPADKSKTFEIGRASHGDVTAEGSAKYGCGGSVELAALIETGASTGAVTVTDNDGIIEGTPVVSNNVLSFVLADDAAGVGKSATVSINVMGALNYSDYAITVTLNVIDCSHEHTTVRDIRKATCTEKGYTGDTYCTDCGAIIRRGEHTAVDPNNHSYDGGVITTQPTILSEGVRTYTCTRCHHQYTESVPRLEDESGEDYGNLIKDVTDDEGKTKAEVETKPKEDGSKETTFKIGGEPVSVVTEEKDGTKTVKSLVWIGGLKSSYTYTGEAIKPEIHVYDGTKELSESDYSIKYTANKTVGPATVKVTFKGNYKSTPEQKSTFEIKPASLSEDVIVTDISAAAKSSVQKPVPTVIWKDSGKIIDKKNFKYAYKDAAGNDVTGVKGAGDYTVTVKPNNSNFAYSATVKITVIEDSKALISKASIRFKPNKYTFTGRPIVPARDSITVTLAGKTLTEGTHYTVNFSNNTEPGRATAVFTAISGSGYYGSKTVTFNIAKGRKLEEAGSGSSFTYTFNANAPYEKGGAKPDVIVKDGGTILSPDTDYSVKYSKNTKITNGEKTSVITVKGKGNYKGSVKLYFAVTKKNIALLKASAADKIESNKGYKKPTVTIMDTNGKKLNTKNDFEIVADSYPASASVGDTITVRITGKGLYEGETKVSYRYIKASQNLNKAKKGKTIEAKIYTGGEIKLKNSDLMEIIYVENGSERKYLVPGKDFRIEGYTDNINKGTAKVVLQGIGEYGGTKTLKFTIKQKTGDCKGALIGGEWK